MASTTNVLQVKGNRFNLHHIYFSMTKKPCNYFIFTILYTIFEVKYKQTTKEFKWLAYTPTQGLCEIHAHPKDSS